MSATKIHVCQCPHCQQEAFHQDKKLHHQMNLFLSRLDEQQRRWYVAMESNRMDTGKDQLLSQITGMDVKTIRRGRQELEADLADRPSERIRLPGGGQPPVEKKIQR
jgi:uncharacterized protein with PhoU and TrkA domain